MIIRNGRKIGHGGLDLGPADPPHDWVPSTLGHGETMCRRCWITNREAAVLGVLGLCEPRPDDAKTFAEDDQPQARPDTGIPEVVTDTTEWVRRLPMAQIEAALALREYRRISEPEVLECVKSFKRLTLKDRLELIYFMMLHTNMQVQEVADAAGVPSDSLNTESTN